MSLESWSPVSNMSIPFFSMGILSPLLIGSLIPLTLVLAALTMSPYAHFILFGIRFFVFVGYHWRVIHMSKDCCSFYLRFCQGFFFLFLIIAFESQFWGLVW